jgi:hypothetical protein
MDRLDGAGSHGVAELLILATQILLWLQLNSSRRRCC